MSAGSGVEEGTPKLKLVWSSQQSSWAVWAAWPGEPGASYLLLVSEQGPPEAASGRALPQELLYQAFDHVYPVFRALTRYRVEPRRDENWVIE